MSAKQVSFLIDGNSMLSAVRSTFGSGYPLDYEAIIRTIGYNPEEVEKTLYVSLRNDNSKSGFMHAMTAKGYKLVVRNAAYSDNLRKFIYDTIVPDLVSEMLLGDSQKHWFVVTANNTIIPYIESAINHGRTVSVATFKNFRDSQLFSRVCDTHYLMDADFVYNVSVGE
jgi:uncharacterized LabA/DUF88 family protein